jgi:hypothetical protein
MTSEQFANLKVHRSDAHAWERRDRWGRYRQDSTWLMSIAGAGLLLYGVYSASRRTGSSRWWVATGASLLSCAAAGVGRWHWLKNVRSRRDPAADVVTLESLDSFPASDAPSSNATTTTPRPLRSRD